MVTPAIQRDIQQNTLHVRQHHIFHIEKWRAYDIQHTTFDFPVWLSHDSCITWVNVTLLRSSSTGQVLEDDHGSPDSGIPHVDETPENPLASHHMFYAIPKHFVILIRNRTKEGLNTISFHGLMPDTHQCFHQLSLRLPWNGYTLWSCLAAELGSSFFSF